MAREGLSGRILRILAGVAVLLGLYLTSLYSYLLFHSLVELFSVIVACGIFMIAWNSRRILDNNYLLFVGIAFLFVGGLDLLQALAHKEMNVFPGRGEYLAARLWIAARYMGSASLLVAPLLLGRNLKPRLIFAAYTAVTALLLVLIFSQAIFPPSADGAGQMLFEKISEYVIAVLFFAALALLLAKRDAFDHYVLKLLVFSILLRIGSDVAFASRASFDDPSSIIGHFLRIISFYLFYKALIETGLVEPYNLLFRNLKQSEEALRAERDRAQNYLDLAKAVLIVINADQGVRLINKKGQEILGYREDEIVGKNWFDSFVPGRVREEVRAAFKKLIAGEIVPVEYFENPILTRSGEERVIAWHNAVLEDDKGKIVATLSSGEDITERKRAEAQLALKTAELERSNAELEHFASIVSHDLKEPLVTIGGFAEILKTRYGNALDEKGKKFLAGIVNGAISMERLISDLLAYSRVTSRARPSEPVNCNTVLGAVLSNLKAAVDESGAVITSDDLPMVRGDEMQFVQLFQNLIGNAIKYRSDSQPRIHVSARPVAEGGDKSAFRAPQSGIKSGWLFSISDNGIGIDSRHFEYIFGIFQRVDHGGKYPGTGIGLAICKKIVERHGGRIWVESAPGKGSTFYFTIA